jgi:hypothetical protein
MRPPKESRFPEPFTPAQTAAIRFGLAAEFGTDPRVAKLCDYKARLDISVAKLKPTPERKARLIAKVRGAYGLDGNKDHRIDVLISSTVDTLLFLARLTPRPATSTKSTFQPEQPQEHS